MTHEEKKEKGVEWLWQEIDRLRALNSSLETRVKVLEASDNRQKLGNARGAMYEARAIILEALEQTGEAV